MSEYWKSTPKYWCKHCKAYIRDTKVDRISHDATPKHQGNLKRFLRDLHRGHERDERDKQRAKDEVERLNGVISGSPASAAEGSTNVGAPWRRKAADPPTSSAQSRQATPAERKQQMAQLAAMGVAVPEDFRREMAMAGDWQTLSERLIYSESVKEDGNDGDAKPNNLNIGIRKRKFEGQEEEEEAGEAVIRRGWGSTMRTYPGDGGDILDTLLGQTEVLRRRDEVLRDMGSGDGKGPSVDSSERTPASAEGMVVSPIVPAIKKEESIGYSPDLAADPEPEAIDAPVVKTEDDSLGSRVVFKKRKPKHIRQK